MTAAKKIATTQTHLETGTVEQLGARLLVRLPDGVYEARRAKSCLVAPDCGDRVLCAMESDAVFVLAVLEGGEGAATRLTADGDVEIAARGSVNVCASERVDLVGAAGVGIATPDLEVRAKRASLAIDELGFLGKLVHAQAHKVVVAAEEIEQRVTRLAQRAKRVFRFVEELDQTRAGTIDTRAEGLLSLRAENALVSARVLAKVDGEQIHLG